ncbi:hypothetical protein H4R34_000053 [Dimargaris verticillata]|uniref:Fanconi Anaemia group E protein C-terminal domain-containing protein n=1 Tax=Dimargaris verticillata TaxID=2761393 RepID=A0A9W8B710_9FUNG|nr:hypothetical protein H4R34_000053 [Dimargaris verticillata]
MHDALQGLWAQVDEWPTWPGDGLAPLMTEQQITLQAPCIGISNDQDADDAEQQPILPALPIVPSSGTFVLDPPVDTDAAVNYQLPAQVEPAELTDSEAANKSVTMSQEQTVAEMERQLCALDLVAATAVSPLAWARVEAALQLPFSSFTAVAAQWASTVQSYPDTIKADLLHRVVDDPVVPYQHLTRFLNLFVPTAIPNPTLPSASADDQLTTTDLEPETRSAVFSSPPTRTLTQALVQAGQTNPRALCEGWIVPVLQQAQWIHADAVTSSVVVKLVREALAPFGVEFLLACLVPQLAQYLQSLSATLGSKASATVTWSDPFIHMLQTLLTTKATLSTTVMDQLLTALDRGMDHRPQAHSKKFAALILALVKTHPDVVAAQIDRVEALNARSMTFMRKAIESSLKRLRK